MTFKLTTILRQDGTLTLDQLPFRAGEQVEVLVSTPPMAPTGPRYPLRGIGARLDDPYEPAAAITEWEACQ